MGVFKPAGSFISEGEVGEGFGGTGEVLRSVISFAIYSAEWLEEMRRMKGDREGDIQIQ